MERALSTLVSLIAAHCRIVFAVGLVASVAPSLAAQSRDSLSLDVTLGPSSGSGGRRYYYDSADIAGEITLALRPHPDRASAWIAAVSVGRRTPAEFGDRCALNPGGAPGCAPAFPSFSHLGLLGGREWRTSHAGVRAFAGPAYYFGGGASGLGGQLHADAAAGFTHLQFVAAVRGMWVDRFSGETLRAHSLEFGLRFQ
jgi:hypothetical protein